MKNKLKYLTKQSLKKKVGTKWFLIANIVLGLLIIGVINIDSIITFFGGNFNEPTEILVIDNTNKTYDKFEAYFNSTISYIDDVKNVKLSLYEDSLDSAEKLVEEEDKVLLVINNDSDNFISAQVITYQGMDAIILQIITADLNKIKSNIALEHYGITSSMLEKIEQSITIENIKLNENKTIDEMAELVMGVVFPIIILPFFMLTMFLVQMIGAEVNEEKTTKSMEIIISNVSPRIHFFSKIIAGNLFVIIQGFLLMLFALIGLIIRVITTGSNLTSSLTASLGSSFTDIINNLKDSGIINHLGTIIPLTLVLMLLTFLTYSLMSGILASMTTNSEDYQQIQTPIIIVSVLGYYLSIMASMFEGSIFIRVLSYIPCISALLAPALLVLGQIHFYDVIISILVLIGTNYLLLKYGLKVYKVGILNYSSEKLWHKIFKAVKD